MRSLPGYPIMGGAGCRLLIWLPRFLASATAGTGGRQDERKRAVDAYAKALE